MSCYKSQLNAVKTSEINRSTVNLCYSSFHLHHMFLKPESINETWVPIPENKRCIKMLMKISNKGVELCELFRVQSGSIKDES